MSRIPALASLRQVDCLEFKAKLGYGVEPCVNNNNKIPDATFMGLGATPGTPVSNTRGFTWKRSWLCSLPSVMSHHPCIFKDSLCSTLYYCTNMPGYEYPTVDFRRCRISLLALTRDVYTHCRNPLGRTQKPGSPDSARKLRPVSCLLKHRLRRTVSKVPSHSHLEPALEGI